MYEDLSVKKQVALRGIGVSPGVAIGPAFLWVHQTVGVVDRTVGEHEREREISRLEDALIETRRQIRRMQKELEQKTGSNEAGIFDAHLMVLDDRSFIEDVVNAVRVSGSNVEAAVRDVSDRYAAVLASVEDEYLRERVADIRDVSRRLIRNLTGVMDLPQADSSHKWIVVATDLTPSETMGMRRDTILGFATDVGSATSHTALLAKALEIPAVVGLHNVTSVVRSGDEVLIDGNKGVVILHPTAEELEKYGRVAEERSKIRRGLTKLQHQPAETRDGHPIVLSANIEGLDDLHAVKEYGAEGVGLFRSEYLHLSRKEIVGEDEQAQVYHDVASRLAPAPVIIRTLDIGGDKFMMDGQVIHEPNPFLGCRSIRLSLLYPAHFKTQLRAILRASAVGNVKIMYPMVSCTEEVLQANALLEEAKQELADLNIPFKRDIDVGVMIEIPGAAMTADLLASHVKFFSLGTNDLIQYTLAVDRGNDRVAYLYQPTHPGVLALIHRTIEAGHRHGIWVGVCGEMAGDPLMTPLLVGLGIDELSVSPAAVPLIKDAVRSMEYARARQLAETCLRMPSASAVRQLCYDMMKGIAPELLELV
jgi:phosphotransferase system enzyme I (PtsI)